MLERSRNHAHFLEEVTTQSGPPEELWEQIDKSNMAAWGFFFFDGKPDRSNSFSATWREKRVSLSLLGCFIPKTCPQWLKKKQKWRPCSWCQSCKQKQRVKLKVRKTFKPFIFYMSFPHYLYHLLYDSYWLGKLVTNCFDVL